jgi:hypothetical protein
MATPKVPCQPMCSAIRGAARAATTVPELPAPALGRVPAADQREGHREAGPGDAEEQADAQQLDEGVATQPAPQQRHGGEGEGQLAEPLDPDPIGLRPEQQAEGRPAERGHGDHEALLRRRQPEVLGDVGAQCAEQHPAHERHVEVHERGDEAGGVPRLSETPGGHGRITGDGRCPTVTPG